MTNYVPKWPILFAGFPIFLEKLFYYTCSFSLALALINIIPCYMLDGQFIIQAMSDLCFPTKSGCISKTFIYFGSGLLLANLLLTFMPFC